MLFRDVGSTRQYAVKHVTVAQRTHSFNAPSKSPCRMLPATVRFFAILITLHDGALFASTPSLPCPTPSSHSSNYSEPDVFKPWLFLTPKTFAIIHLNIQDLIGQTIRKALEVCDTHSKIDYLHCSVRDTTAQDVICQTKTKLSDQITLPDYDVIRRDRNRRGGDVAIYGRSPLRARALDPLPNSVVKIECCVTEADFKQNLTVCISCFYKPPSIRLPEWGPTLSCMLDDLSLDRKPLIVTGDLNVNLLHDNSFADRIKTDHHLSQLINEPTRITKNSATLIDHIYCLHKSMIYFSGVTNIHLSDHHLTFFELSNMQCATQKKFNFYRRIARVSKEQFINDFHALPWSLIDAAGDIDNAVTIFESLFRDLRNLHTPIKKRLTRSINVKH